MTTRRTAWEKVAMANAKILVVDEDQKIVDLVTLKPIHSCDTINQMRSIVAPVMKSNYSCSGGSICLAVMGQLA